MSSNTPRENEGNETEPQISEEALESVAGGGPIGCFPISPIILIPTFPTFPEVQPTVETLDPIIFDGGGRV